MLLLLLLLSLLPAAEWAGGRGPGRAAPDPRFPTGSPAQDRRYWLEVQESLEVQEGLCASVPCSFLYPLNNWNDSFPVHGYWFRETPFLLRSGPVATNKPGLKVQPEAQGRFRLLGNPRDYDCSLDIRDARRSDSGKYFFRVERGSFVKYNFQWNLLSVNVTALTQTPNIHIQGLLEPGQPKNITCSVPWACKRGTAPTFSWIGDALTSRGPRTLLSSMITLIPRPQDHGTNLTCRVTFPGANVRAETSIRLNMSWDRLFVPAPDVPQNLTIHIFRGNSTGPRLAPVPPLLRTSPWLPVASEKRPRASPVCEPPSVSLQTARPTCVHAPPRHHTEVYVLGCPLPGLDVANSRPEAELVPGKPDPEPFPALASWCHSAAPAGLGGWRRIHLPSSARVGLQPRLPEPNCAGTLLFLPPHLWRAAEHLAPGPHPAQRGPHGGWLPSHLWPHLALLYQVQRLQRG
ncbi:myeloid cell surface antigen CD33-like isoform X2 [Suricata suricatta]|uniref:myeloid cell surface antigen CD33-like isoform X2 n=1 Tax=Suricata suricatta TaxID=37032 RepID=UPI001155369E|nr:myeloid cell surface antigen CD33-like isoform X2 [Suricata suricatta]